MAQHLSHSRPLVFICMSCSICMDCEGRCWVFVCKGMNNCIRWVGCTYWRLFCVYFWLIGSTWLLFVGWSHLHSTFESGIFTDCNFNFNSARKFQYPVIRRSPSAWLTGYRPRMLTDWFASSSVYFARHMLVSHHRRLRTHLLAFYCCCFSCLYIYTAGYCKSY